jgi:hypothetical protein
VQFFVFVPMCAGVIFLVLEQQFDMAEREQVFLITYLPFLVLRYAVWTQPGIKTSGPLALITGLAAGLGLALKPQFCGAHAAFELVLLARNGKLMKRLLRTEIVGVLFVMVVYACYLYFLLPKEAWDVLKNEIMPLFVYGYEYSSKGLMFMFHGGPYFYLPVTMLCYAMTIALVTNRFSQWAAPLAAFSLVGLFNYLHGDQAWVYRLMPMVAGCYLLCGLAIGLIGKYMYDHTRAPKAVASFLLASFVLTASIYTWWDFNYTNEDLKLTQHFHNLRDIGDYVGWTPCPALDLSQIFMAIIKYSNPGDKVLYMGTGINDGYPAIVQTGRRCATRYPFCPLIVIDHCIISRPESEKQKWIQLMYKQLEDYKQDIIRDQPDLILILDYPPFTDMLKRYGFFDRCIAGYTKYTKHADVLVYVPKWNRPKDPWGKEGGPPRPESLGPAPSTEKTPSASSTEPGKEPTQEPAIKPIAPQETYPDLPVVPPVGTADTEPPDEVVVPLPMPPKPREKDEPPTTPEELELLLPPLPKAPKAEEKPKTEQNVPAPKPKKEQKL